MGVRIEMHNTGDPELGRETMVEDALPSPPGDWRVIIMGSQGSGNWEMKILGPSAFERLVLYAVRDNIVPLVETPLKNPAQKKIDVHRGAMRLDSWTKPGDCASRRNAIARNSWKPASQPEWLTEQTYAEKIQPLLAKQSGCAIAKKIGVSKAYAGRIREGLKRPHPRHWQALAGLVGLCLKC